jgi:hypothetical protein
MIGDLEYAAGQLPFVSKQLSRHEAMTDNLDSSE